MTTQRKDSMGEVAINNNLKAEKEPSSISQTSGWANKGMQIGGLIVQGLIGSGPLLLTCMCLFLAYKNRKKPNTVLPRSVSLAALRGGKVTWQRILASAEPKLDKSVLELALKQFKDLLQSEEPIRFTKLQKEAAKLEMTGQEDMAVKMLKKAYEKAKENGKLHEAYEFEMLLVEMLIYKGDFEEALIRSCLKEEEIFDARRPLYKAVIFTILMDRERAKKSYDEIVDIQTNFNYSTDDIWEESPSEYDTQHNFDKFEKAINSLKKEISISNARKYKSMKKVFILPKIGHD